MAFGQAPRGAPHPNPPPQGGKGRTDLEALLRAGGFGRTIPSRLVLEHPVRERLPVGIPRVDALLEGGVPVGALTQWIGGRSSGRTGAMFSLLAGVTGAEELAVYVDAADTFDPRSAEQRGVDLKRVLWIRCRERVDRALKAADLLIHAGGFRLVALDLGDLAPARLRRIPFGAYLRLTRAVAGTSTAVVLSAEQPLAGTAAAVTVRFSRSSGLWSGRQTSSRLLLGIRNDPLVKARGRASVSIVHANPICLPEGSGVLRRRRSP